MLVEECYPTTPIVGDFLLLLMKAEAAAAAEDEDEEEDEEDQDGCYTRLRWQHLLLVVVEAADNNRQLKFVVANCPLF